MSALSGQLTCIDLIPTNLITCLSTLKFFSKSSAPCFPPHLVVSTAASSACGVICPLLSHMPPLCLFLPSPCQLMLSSIYCCHHLSTSHQHQPVAAPWSPLLWSVYILATHNSPRYGAALMCSLYLGMHPHHPSSLLHPFSRILA